MNVTLFSKNPYLTAHMKINFETGCIKKLLVGLVSSFQPLTNFTKNPNDAMVVLNALLIYSNTIMYLPLIL